MKDRAVWAFLAFALLVLGGIYVLRRRPAPPPAAPVASTPTAPIPVGNPAPPKVAPPAPAAETGPMLQLGRDGQKLPIQDGKTIDMSSGRPVVIDDAHSRAVIEKSLREMEEAAKSVTFGPRPAAPATEKKKEEPAPPAPKS